MLIQRLQSSQRPSAAESGRARRRVAPALLALFLLVPLGLAAEVSAQETSIRGRVISADARRPLPDAHVEVVGTDRVGLTQTNGIFLLTGVSGSEVTLRVTLLGYRTVERGVRVGDLNVEIVLEPAAVVLDEVMVTGTAGGQQVRALGNAVGKIDASDITEIAAPQDVRSLIGSRVPSVNIVNGAGGPGAGGSTAIRGVGSISLSHEPLVYIDGVRVNNENDQGGTGSSYNAGTSRINDINPEDIESIEVIKGPAATTLYGTEASNGVIQIITKRGRAQSAQWDLRIDQGATYLPNPTEVYPTVWARQGGELISMNILQNEIDNGPGSPFRTGHNQAYGLSVRGGTEGVQYYLSGDWNRAEGIVDYNWQNKLNLRSNLNFLLGEKADLQFNLSTARLRTQSSGYQPITTMILWGTPLLRDARTRGFLIAAPEDYDQIESIEAFDRAITSLQLNHRPTSWLNHRLTAGADFGFRRGTQLIERTAVQPGPWGADSRGAKDVAENRSSFATIEYAATAGFDMTSDLRTETSVGGSFFRRVSESSSASGDVFPVPGLETVSSTSERSSGESYVEERTVGAYVQQQVSFRNRMFLTAGVRGDDHSAFGKNFDFVVYPKVMGSWVLSEEPFMSGMDVLSTLRLRGAWGQAGQQPSSIAAVRLYSPSTGNNATPTVSPSNIGNPDLEPEKGEEIEVGFDLGLFDDRLGFEFTYYNQKTKQALIDAPVRPSMGFPGSQSLNVGEVANSGFEFALNTTPIRRDNVNWTLSAALGTNSNEIIDLGGVVIPPGTQNAQVEGYPISGIFMRRVVSAEYDAGGNLINVMCDGGTGTGGQDSGGPAVACAGAPRVFWGGPLPKWQGSVSTTLTLFRELRLYALADFQGGHWRNNGDVAASHLFFTNSRCINEVPICDPELAAYASLGEVWQTGTMKAGFAKLRTLSASYTLPSWLVGRTGASRGTITVAGQNLMRLWTAQNEMFGHRATDPEIGKESTALDTYNQESWPQFTTITTSIRLSF